MGDIKQLSLCVGLDYCRFRRAVDSPLWMFSSRMSLIASLSQDPPPDDKGHMCR